MFTWSREAMSVMCFFVVVFFDGIKRMVTFISIMTIKFKKGYEVLVCLQDNVNMQVYFENWIHFSISCPLLHTAISFPQSLLHSHKVCFTHLPIICPQSPRFNYSQREAGCTSAAERNSTRWDNAPWDWVLSTGRAKAKKRYRHNKRHPFLLLITPQTWQEISP